MTTEDLPDTIPFKARHNPIVVEAVKYIGANFDYPEPFNSAIFEHSTWPARCTVMTPDGPASANVGDYLVREDGNSMIFVVTALAFTRLYSPESDKPVAAEAPTDVPADKPKRQRGPRTTQQGPVTDPSAETAASTDVETTAAEAETSDETSTIADASSEGAAASDEFFAFIERIAQATHEANREYCISIGDDSQLPWDEAHDWQKQSARNGVQFVLNNPDAPLSALHDNWLAEKHADGWKYGDVKDVEKKEHPCFVPYDQLPLDQQHKDKLFRDTVESILNEKSE